VVINRKPRNMIEALDLAEKASSGAQPYPYAVVRPVTRAMLIRTVLNWMPWTILSDELFNVMRNMIERNEIRLCNTTVSIPFTYFNDLISSIGVSSGGVIVNAFDLPKSGNKVACDRLPKTPVHNSVPMLCSSDEDIRKTMLVRPNAWVVASKPEAQRIVRLRARLLVPDRIRWNTWRVVAVYSNEPLIANRFFMVNLKDGNETMEKALAAWLNTTFGILTILSNIEETEGAFTRMNIGQWRVLPVLNVRALGSDQLARLAEVFDKFSSVQFARLPEQYGHEPDPNRLELDISFLRAVRPDIDVAETKRCLAKLYAEVRNMFIAWIGK